MKKIVPTILSVLRSKKFFLAIVVLLVIQAVWTALTARYPMAFDENFHFGLIQIYSHQWAPFFHSAPPNSAEFGDLIRNPSYLYHYLMSFPYRFITLFTRDQTTQIILLRFLNIGMFAGGLFAFRRLLLQLRISAAITNLSLLMLVLVPVVPFLAGQINYDNLLFLAVPIVTLLALTCSRAIASKGCIPASSLILFLTFCMLASLVKYAFLPVFAALVLYLLVMIVKAKHKSRIFRQTLISFQSLRLWMKLGLIVGLVVAGGLFMERYGVNLVVYKNIQPDCAKLESVDQCLQYGPWARNYTIAQNNQLAGEVPLSPEQPLFLPNWVTGMMHRLYFAINYDYTNYFELPLPIATAYVVGIVGLILLLVYARTILKNNPLLFLPIGVVGIYVAGLLYVNYTDYLHFKTMLAINGRYLILILPLFFALIATAYSTFLHHFAVKKARSFKVGLVVVTLLLTLQGGGVLTYAVRSDADWYWPNSTAITLGLGLKNAVTPFIIGANTRQRA